MTDNSNTSQVSPSDLIEQALDIIMNRFDLDAEQALKVLRNISRETRTQMCVVAEQLINDDDPLGALRRAHDAPLRLAPEAKR
jgi:AmiR/NasT family two-component response regulator